MVACGVLPAAPRCRGGGADHLLEVVPRDVGVAVARERDLALFGHLEPPVDGAGWLGDDRAGGRSAAAAEGPAPAMEEGHGDPLPTRPCRDRRLRLVELD